MTGGGLIRNRRARVKATLQSDPARKPKPRQGRLGVATGASPWLPGALNDNRAPSGATECARPRIQSPLTGLRRFFWESQSTGSRPWLLSSAATRLREACVVTSLLVVLAAALSAAAGAVESFLCLAHDERHTGIADSAGPPLLGAPRFVAAVPNVELVGPATPVVADFKAYVYGEYYDEEQHTYTDAYVLAFDELDGSLLWSRAIEPRAVDSWSSPAVLFGEVSGEPVERVVVGSGQKLYSLDAHTGAILWSAALEHSVVNASPIVAAGTVFVTDSTGFGPGGKLYAHRLLDGALLWSREVGETNGNTPAYADGAVYAGTADGAVCSINASDGAENWRRALCSGSSEGFFGGLSVQGGALYIASYDFYGGEDNATLFKLDADDGSVLWSTPAERTDSIPVVAGARLFLAGGIEGFGARRKLECFDEPSGTLLWSYDGAGGWLQQPCYADGLLYVGLIPAGGYAFGPATDLHVLDASKQPGDPGFVLDVYGDAGSSPSVANGNVYSIGMLGGDTALYAFGPSLDDDGDGLANVVETDTGVYVDRYDTGTDPDVPDTDDDGLSDGEEVRTYATDPTKADSDGDGANDGDEIAADTDPNDPTSRFRITCIDRGSTTITWTTVHGRTYVVQFSDGTPNGAYDPGAIWHDIPESQVTESDGSPGDDGTESWTDDGTSSAGFSTTGSRFCRVRIVGQ